MALLIANSSQLLTLSGPPRPRRGKELSALGLILKGEVLIEDGKIAAAGSRELVRRHAAAKEARVIDAGGRVVLPGFVDSHSHPVFVEPRLGDFEARLKGRSYAQIAAEGGGILSTVDGVRRAREEELAAALKSRARRFLEAGTTTLEAKSGYGLDLDSELKMLRAIKTVALSGSLEIVSTFIGAHAVPAELKGRSGDYVSRVISEMIPAVVRERLAVFADVFCEPGFFSLDESRRVLAAAKSAGLRSKIHAEQLTRSGGVGLALEARAASADHLDCVSESDIGLLAGAGTVACLVPGSNYFLGKPYPPARRLIDGGAAVALATDFNPGTCPCWDMRMILSLACTQLKMTPAEALAAATINGAHALGLGETHGSLEPGKQGDVLVYDAEDYREIPYYFGTGGARLIVKKGEVVFQPA